MVAFNFQTLGKNPYPSVRAMEPELATRPLINSVVYDGFDFGIHFTYFDGIPEVVKAEPFFGRFIATRNNPYYRFWRFRKQVIDDSGKALLDAVREAAGESFYADWAGFSKHIEDAQLHFQPSAFALDLKLAIYSLEFGSVALVGSYHPGVVSLCKNMGGRYLAPMKAWKVASTSAIALKNNLLMELMLREDQVEIVEGVCGIVDDSFVARKGNDVTIGTLNNAQPEQGLAEAEEGDNEVYLAVTAPLGRSTLSPQEIENHIARYDLYDYQQVGVRHLLGSNSALLADDMGLGKSRQAVAAAHILAGDEKILITCPASLIINWTREIRMLVPDATIAQQEFDPACQWIVTNYERLDSMIHHARHFKVMVTDEAHLLKEPTSKRTRLAFDVASKVPYRFILTGTPILNRECEIHTLLRLSGHPVGNIPLKTFEEQFAGDPAFRIALNQRISEWMLRRKKDVVLKTLKGKQHQISFVSPSEEQRTQYDALANNSMLQALPKIVKLRVLLEQIKVDSVIELVREMNSDDKVLVFCEFKETVAALREQLQAMGVGVVTMVGSDSITRRQKAVDAFQSDPEKRAFVGTTSAAGVGNNLTAANYVIFASLPWTPALKDQAEDRAYRNGQLRLVIVKIPLMENTIDQDLWEMLKHKKGIATEILDPEEAEAAAMAELANRIAA